MRSFTKRSHTFLCIKENNENKAHFHLEINWTDDYCWPLLDEMSECLLYNSIQPEIEEWSSWDEEAPNKYKNWRWQRDSSTSTGWRWRRRARLLQRHGSHHQENTKSRLIIRRVIYVTSAAGSLSFIYFSLSSVIIFYLFFPIVIYFMFLHPSNYASLAFSLKNKKNTKFISLVRPNGN